MGFRYVCMVCGKTNDFGRADHPYPCEVCGSATWAEWGWRKKEGCLVVRDEAKESNDEASYGQVPELRALSSV